MTCILGLETSCDETAAAIVQDGTRVRSSIVASQHALHERYQGVVPEIASRAHLERIGPVIEDALREADVSLEQVTAIAVGNRPGLIGSLLVGVSAAQALAWATGKPLIGIDHIEAHLYAAALTRTGQSEFSRSAYPALGLVVSGGHTSLYELAGPTSLVRIGSTIDDAVGEAYDKAAVILQLGYPGGPKLDKLAQHGNPRAHDLPRSLLGRGSLDFSFSGLKTALLYAVRGQPTGRGRSMRFERSADELSEAQRADFAAAFQAAVVDTLIIKLERALDHMIQHGSAAQSLVIGGGVSANSLLRQRVAALGAARNLPVHLPEVDWCVDNAAMIAGLAYHYYRQHAFADLNLPAIATSSR